MARYVRPRPDLRHARQEILDVAFQIVEARQPGAHEVGVEPRARPEQLERDLLQLDVVQLGEQLAVVGDSADVPQDGDALGPDCAGLIVADRYDAEVIRPAPLRPLAAARRKAETLRFARRAARRLAGDLDPGLAGLD